MNVRQALQIARENPGNSADPSTLEAQVLLAEVLGRSRANVVAHPELELTPEQEQRYLTDLTDVQAGVPLAYLLGWQEFYGRRFEVSRATLIPRPETEQLVELALEKLQPFARARAADVGTGSGCIAVTIACEFPTAFTVATDRSGAALAVAVRNARRHDVLDRLRFLQGDLLGPLSSRFHLICANLPYIPSGRVRNLAVARYEPGMALDGGRDGMRFTASLIRQLPGLLAENGFALLEIDHGQGAELERLAAQVLPGSRTSVHLDLAGMERILQVERAFC